MNRFLTQDDPTICRRYHYNFERQAPRLFAEQKIDSIRVAADFVNSECGPAANVEVTRLLLHLSQGSYGDSLVGSSTLSRMLWFRRQVQEEDWMCVYSWDAHRWGENNDNTRDKFIEFLKSLALLSGNRSPASPSAAIISQFYRGEYDSAFREMQQPAMQNTALGKSYVAHVRSIKKAYSEFGHLSFLIGGWNPQGANRRLGSFPEVGLQFGGETKRWRTDFALLFRPGDARDSITVDSAGSLVTTNRFEGGFLGLEQGLKFFDTRTQSADMFVSLGYELVYSKSLGGNPEEHVSHNSWSFGGGLRYRLFVFPRLGWYVGGIARYSFVDYPNPRGSDISGNTLSLSLVLGISGNATRRELLDDVNYRGDYRSH